MPAKLPIKNVMLIDTHIFEEARQARDPRFDGRFFIGVKTTGVYCRPVCPVKIPKAQNVEFYLTAAGAAEAGFRPCLRCRPETSPGTPAWNGTSTTVTRALRLIADGALDSENLRNFSDRLGVTPRHLNRLFRTHLGASPGAIAQTRRLQFAKKMIDETSLSMTEVALSAGYGSVRRFNDHFKNTYGRTPRSMRKHNLPTDDGALEFSLSYRLPFDFTGMLDFFAMRAIPDVEFVNENSYTRTLRIEDRPARLSICNVAGEQRLRCRVLLSSSAPLVSVAERVRRLFDLNAFPLEIECHLNRDSALRPMIKQHPGQRLPGAWDAFEIAIRAVVGQQVSVKGATTIMGRIAAQYGEHSEYGLLFPTPSELSVVDVDSLPMPRSRAMALRDLANAVADGTVDFKDSWESLSASLLAIKGIGPWTSQYIAMRATNDPDAFLDGDLVLLKVAKQQLGIDSATALAERSNKWRPWRAYACMHLWRQA
jgi:AraC family transcriptional regulator, regulatory protein of adaptative response / DNA-3-methyladenine glycosylase II